MVAHTSDSDSAPSPGDKTPPKGKKPASKGGRPTDYDPDKCPATAIKILRMGGTDADISEALDVSTVTLYDWRKKFPEFDNAVKTGRRFADDNVEASLYQRATGCSHPDTHVSNFQGEITLTPIVKHYAPDPTSMIFWLKNRRPREWRDRIDLAVEVEHKLSDAEQAAAFANSFRATLPIMERVTAAIEARTVEVSASAVPDVSANTNTPVVPPS